MLHAAVSRIADDADDLVLPIAAKGQRLAQRVAARHEPLGECLVDDDHRLTAGAVATLESSSTDERHPQRAEIIGRHDLKVRRRLLRHRLHGLTVNPDAAIRRPECLL